MRPHAWKNTLAISITLAAGGILSCIGAILETFMPKGSPVAFLAMMILLGLAVGGVLVGFAWVCEKCEGWLSKRFDRVRKEGQNNNGKKRAGGSRRRGHRLGSFRIVKLGPAACQYYVEDLRGPARTKPNVLPAVSAERRWRLP